MLPAIQYGVIAGILDHGGGRRVVMSTDPFSPAANTIWHKGERCFVAPGIWAMSKHPLENDTAWIVWWGERAVLDATRDGCGACRACCITLFIANEGDGFSKPSHTPCSHLCNDGCSVYAKRPKTCSRFECVWLKSQQGNDPMGSELRPDRCGSILTDHEGGPIHIHTGRHVSAPSAVLQAWVKEREALGWTFEDVRFYYGEC